MSPIPLEALEGTGLDGAPSAPPPPRRYGERFTQLAKDACEEVGIEHSCFVPSHESHS